MAHLMHTVPSGASASVQSRRSHRASAGLVPPVFLQQLHTNPGFQNPQAVSHRRASVGATPKQHEATSATQPAAEPRKAGRMTYRPASFAELVQDAVVCVQDGIKNGLTRMEVEFPPVPVKLDGGSGTQPMVQPIALLHSLLCSPPASLLLPHLRVQGRVRHVHRLQRAASSGSSQAGETPPASTWEPHQHSPAHLHSQFNEHTHLTAE